MSASLFVVESGASGGEQLPLFSGVAVDVGALARQRAELVARARPVNTVRAYASDWRCFSRWCALAGRAALPASADTLGLYLVDLAAHGAAYATIARRVVGVAAHLRAAGGGSPAPRGGDVAEVLGALARRLGRAPRHRKAAVSLEELRAMLGACPVDGALGLRDRALLLVGFASGLRRSELVALDLSDVSFRREGVLVRVGRGKTDQAGVGRELGVHFGRHRETCPVRALRAWVRERALWDGPLFPFVSPYGAVSRRRLAPAAVAAVVQAAARRAGLDAARFGAHSLRAGCATAAAELGRDALAIAARTGHRSLAVLAGYVRHGSVFAVDPLRGAL